MGFFYLKYGIRNYGTKNREVGVVTEIKPWKVWLVRVVGTGFGIGYLRGAGTIGSAVVSVVWCLLYPLLTVYTQITVLAWLVLLTVFTGDTAEELWGAWNTSRVNLGKWTGMWIVLMCIPYNIFIYLFAFAVFRCFDMLRTLPPTKWMNTHLSAGLGILLTDILAAIYTIISVRVSIAIGFLIMGG